MLDRQEVERRLGEVAPANLDDYQNYRWCRERDALQTAQSLYAQLERQRDSWQREVDITEAERDQLAAEGRALEGRD